MLWNVMEEGMAFARRLRNQPPRVTRSPCVADVIRPYPAGLTAATKFKLCLFKVDNWRVRALAFGCHQVGRLSPFRERRSVSLAQTCCFV